MTNPNSGEFILKQLQRFGSDTNSRHEVSFWLYFQSQDCAKKAAYEINGAGLETKVVESSTDSNWLCLAYCPHIPDEQILDGIFELLTEVTKQHGGIIDGWETSLEGE